VKGNGHVGLGVIKSKYFSGQQRSDSAEVFYYCCFLSIFHLPRSSLFLGSALELSLWAAEHSLAAKKFSVDFS